ncbi:MAG: hypothetical protein LBD95_04685, partial [Clostridiales Family XIII bacterium]|nr:hypothetical protein [Clostridiales Family XIII bacterium]
SSSDDFNSYYYYSNFNLTDDLLFAARVLEPFLGDLYMERDGDTHTISLNRLELFKIIRDFSEGESLYYTGIPGDYSDFLNAVPAADYTLRIREEDGVIASMELDIHAKIEYESYDGEEPDVVEFRCKASAEAQKASVDYSLAVDRPEFSAWNFRLHADAVRAPTDETPRTAPPDGAKIVSPDEL